MILEVNLAGYFIAHLAWASILPSKEYSQKTGYAFHDDTPLKTMEYNNERQCAASCQMLAACISFSYRGDTKVCLLHAKSSQTYPEMVVPTEGAVFWDQYHPKNVEVSS